MPHRNNHQGPVAAIGAPSTISGRPAHGAYSNQALKAQKSIEWMPPTVDMAALLAAGHTASSLAAAIMAASDGVLVLRNALQAPFGSISDLFGRVTPERAARANAAYQAGTSRLVWKDAHGEGRCVQHIRGAARYSCAF